MPSNKKYISIKFSEEKLNCLAEGGLLFISLRVHRQTPIRVHPWGVTISCIR